MFSSDTPTTSIILYVFSAMIGLRLSGARTHRPAAVSEKGTLQTLALIGKELPLSLAREVAGSGLADAK